jgi:hypothetical protein
LKFQLNKTYSLDEVKDLGSMNVKLAPTGTRAGEIDTKVYTFIETNGPCTVSYFIKLIGSSTNGYGGLCIFNWLTTGVGIV